MASIDIKQIEEHYSKMPDSEIERIATTDADGLRPEVFGIIEKEITKRKLNPNILKGAIAQNKEYSIQEIENYSELLRTLPCPVCNGTSSKLNGTISHTVKSLLIITSYGTAPTIACPDCLDKKNNDAIVSTALFGWWGFPWGILKTPLYIYRNVAAKKQNRLERANETLLAYTLGRIGEIETYRDNKEKLGEIIKPKNS